MKYKGKEIPDSGIAGVKRVHRGKNKGKWQAFYKKNNLIFLGKVRDHEYQAVFDLSLLKARVYL